MLLVLQQNLGFAWGNVAAVTVPDVVGDLEAAGTAEIELLGLTVSVTTAYSSVVAIGLIISQNPAGGSEVAPGSNVAIVVSLGEAPVASSSGGGWYMDFERHARERKRRKDELDEIEEQQERIEDEASREIARLLQIQERKDAERKDIERIKALVTKYKDVSPEVDSERVLKALNEAKQKATRANLERLQREFERMVEEEDDFLALLFIALNE